MDEELKLKNFLIDSGLVSRADISVAEEEASELEQSLGKILVMRGKISEDDLRKMKSHILGIPFVDLKNKKIHFDILSTIPEPIARNYNLVAFNKNGEVLEVAMLDSDDLEAIDFLREKTGLKILPRLTDRDSIKASLLEYQKMLKGQFGDLITKASAVIKNIPDILSNKKPLTLNEFRKISEEESVVEIVDTILKHALVQKASDIHIEPEENDLLIRYRIDGILHDAMVLSKKVEMAISTRIKILASLKLGEVSMPQDGRFKIKNDNDEISVRVSILPTFFGEKIVIRVLRQSSFGFTLEKLGFHGESLDKIHKAMKAKSGMILVTGPSDSGKTSILYTMLDILNTRSVNISTVEDPIEYQMKKINQTQVREDVGLNMASGLRTLTRQDPDIIMVSGISSEEVLGLSLNTAKNHLLLSALDARDFVDAVENLLNMKTDPYLLSSVLGAFISTRLVRKLSDQKEMYFLNKLELLTLGKSVNLNKILKALIEEKVVGKNDTWDKIPFWRPKKGLKDDVAYSGRVGIQEVLTVSSEVKDIIKSGELDLLNNVMDQSNSLGILEDGVFKVVQGLTSIEEVFKVMTER